MKIGGLDYTVKAVIANGKNGERYYDHALTQIEKGKIIEAARSNKPSATNDNPISDIKDKRLLSILQINPDEISKVVDSNGEPMPLFHGTGKEFTEFRKPSIENQTRFWGYHGIYFTPLLEHADFYRKENKGKNILCHRKKDKQAIRMGDLSALKIK